MADQQPIQYRIVYWRDIPVNLQLRRGRQRHVHALPHAFQQTVYRAAYRSKAITGEAYMASWHTGSWQDLDDSAAAASELEAAGRALAAALIQAYDEARLNELALNKGVEPGKGDGA